MTVSLEEHPDAPAPMKVVPLKALVGLAAFVVPLFTASLLFTINAVSKDNISTHNENPIAHSAAVKAITEENRKEIMLKLDSLSDDVAKLNVNQAEMKETLRNIKGSAYKDTSLYNKEAPGLVRDPKHK